MRQNEKPDSSFLTFLHKDRFKFAAAIDLYSLNRIRKNKSEFYNYFATGGNMISNDYIGQGNGIKVPVKGRKSGKSRAMPPSLEAVIATLFKRGYGYRAIARILRREYHNNPDYSAVRRALERLGLMPGSS